MLADRQRLLKDRLCLFVVADRLIENGQVVEAAGEFRMVLAQQGPLDLQRFQVRLFSQRVLARLTMKIGQVVQAVGGSKRLGALFGAGTLQRLCRERQSILEFALLDELADMVIQLAERLRKRFRHGCVPSARGSRCCERFLHLKESRGGPLPETQGGRRKIRTG